MSRQKSKSKTHGHAPAASPLDREQAANKALNAGRFREAIEGFKELLKTGRRNEWIEALAQAYVGRAGELQAKGMIPEALTIWRNRASTCDKPLAHPGYIECLCKSGATVEALKLVTQMEAGEERQALENHLAATAVLLPPEALSTLPEDHALRSQHSQAVAALHAYCAGDGKALDEALQRIPFRSPYRDLRPVLKALNVVQQDPEQANTLLARVTNDSPFAKLAAVARSAILPDDAWLPALAQASPAQQQALLDLKGCPQESRAQLQELAQLGADPDPVKVLDILLRPHSKRTPRTEALCHYLLPYVEKPSQQHRTFAGQLPQFKRQRIAALANELNGDPTASAEFWLDAVKAMEKIPEQTKNAALILHRLALGRKVEGPQKDLSKEDIQLLERSLKLDSDNPQARLRLIHAYAKASNAKQARTHLEVALATAPDDPQTLLAAVETAIASDSHKKAEGYAKRLLELDPINPQVRGLIARAGLAQARKQIRGKRMDLALKALDEALPWIADAPGRALAGVLRALCTPDGGDDAALRTAATGLGGSLCAAFYLTMEAYRLKWEPKALLSRANIPLDAKPDAADLAQFVRLLDACDDKEGKALAPTLKLLRRSIELGASLALTPEERTAVCEALLRRRAYQTLDVHAKSALKQSPKAPIFVYFSAVAACQDRPWDLTDYQIEKLEDALDQAQTKDDKRTAGRIADFLRRDEEYEEDFDEDDDFGPFDPGDIDPRSMLRAMIAMSGTKHFLDMIRRNIGSATFDAMKAQAGQNEQKLVDLLIDYMLTHSPKGDLLPGGFGGKPGAPHPKSSAKSNKSKKLPSATDDSDDEVPF